MQYQKKYHSALELEGEGIGFDPDRTTERFSLYTLKDRLLRLGGNPTIDSTPGKGTVQALCATQANDTGFTIGKNSPCRMRRSLQPLNLLAILPITAAVC